MYLSQVPADMRCSFEGLSAKIKVVIQQDQLTGHLFVFLNRQRDYIKMQYWDDGGYYIWTKRLERGTFELPESSAAPLKIDTHRFMLMIGEIALDKVKKERYLRQKMLLC